MGVNMLSLGIRFYAVNEASGTVSKLKGELAGLDASLASSSKFANNMGFAQAAIGGAGLFMVRGMAAAVKEGAAFHFMMRSVEAITETTTQQMDVLYKKAIKVGADTIFDPADVASAMRFMAMAGQAPKLIEQSIAAATNMAGATMTALGGRGGSADIMTSALKAFGWSGERSNEMADVLTAASTKANVQLTDLGNSIRYVAATSRNLNIPMQDTVGMLMTLGNAGIQGSMAGTALENMYRYLANSVSDFASANAKASWAQMGLSKKDLVDAQGNLLPILDIITMISERIQGMGTVDTQNIFKNIFGVRGQRGAATVLRNLSEAKNFTGMLRDESQIGGGAERKMNMMMDSLGGALDKWKSNIEGFNASYAKVLEGPLMTFFKVITEALGRLTTFMETPLGGVLTKSISTGILLATTGIVVSLAKKGLAFALNTGNFKKDLPWMGVQNAAKYAAQTSVASSTLASSPYILGNTGYRINPGGGKTYTKNGRTMSSGLGMTDVNGREVTPGRGGTLWAVNSAGRKVRIPNSTATFSHSQGLNIVGRRAPVPALVNIRRFTPAPPAATMRTGFAALASRMGPIFGGILTALGPISAGLMVLGMVIPPLVALFSKNKEAIAENTAELKKINSVTPGQTEKLMLLSQYRIADIMLAYSKISTRLLLEGNGDLKALAALTAQGNVDANLALLLGQLNNQIGPAKIGANVFVNPIK